PDELGSRSLGDRPSKFGLPGARGALNQKRFAEASRQIGDGHRRLIGQVPGALQSRGDMVEGLEGQLPRHRLILYGAENYMLLASCRFSWRVWGTFSGATTGSAWRWRGCSQAAPSPPRSGWWRPASVAFTWVRGFRTLPMPRGAAMPGPWGG